MAADNEVKVSGLGTIKEMESFPENCNAFNHDAYHMGQNVGKDLTLMYRNFSQSTCEYLILVNTRTGKRFSIQFEDSFINK